MDALGDRIDDPIRKYVRPFVEEGTQQAVSVLWMAHARRSREVVDIRASASSAARIAADA